jgi:hypothetical protein
MFSAYKSRWMPAALLLAALATSCAIAAQGEEDRQGRRQRYSVASLHGDYAAVATYGANVAQALGTQYLDGRGGVRGSALVNQPGAQNSRQLSRISFSGTYVVNSNGTGALYLTLALPGGKTAEAVEDFVITRARVIEGVPTATEIVDAQEEPSQVIPGGVFVTHTYTRRPE